MNCDFLKCLNPDQLKAVQHPPTIPLQILAGPGSGKTKVLTSRIAYLILHHNLPPSSICAVTFTNKAALEMRERLTMLIGKEKTAEVRMGTFHALCALFLRMYSNIIGLEGNFTVCDADESKRIISKLLAPYKEVLVAKNLNLSEGTVLSLISKAKAKGHGPDEMSSPPQMGARKRQVPGAANDVTQKSDIDIIVFKIYKDYESYLRKNNSLDFDDLLLFGVKLFSCHRKAVQWCKHVLVDEFQDTNIMQYELMRHIASANHCVTIVGDPDQSIYGWRSAEVENLHKMRKDFSKTKQILLEQNYRSTGSILSASVAIVSQDQLRIPKTLQASHPTGPLPELHSFASEHEEAMFIATEIKRVLANMGGVLKWGDFAVLLRFNALSRTIEGALQKEGIPNRVLAGHKFFERLEVKDLLAYLHIVDNPQFAPAFLRAINVPGRGIGEKTLNEVISRAERTKISPLEAVEQIYDSEAPDIKPPIKRKLDSFIKTVRELRSLANNGGLPADLIRRLVELTGYEDHLKRTQPDWQSRWENVQELINFASEVQLDMDDGVGSSAFSDPTEMGIKALNMIHMSEEQSASLEPKTVPLRQFLQASMLSSDGDNDGEEKDQEKVTISTCHAAKGLEWPVVMIPAVENGTFPFYRTEDVEEERRLLYVACTRAQGLLYLSSSIKRKVGGFTKTRELSQFISTIAKPNQAIFTDKTLEFSTADRALIARVLDRPEPESSEVSQRLSEFNRNTRYRSGECETPVLTPSQNGVGSIPSSSTCFLPSSTLKDAQNALSHVAGSQPRPSAPSKTLPIPRILPPSCKQTVVATKCSLRASDSLTAVQNIPPCASLHITDTNNSKAPRKRLGMGRGTMGYPNKKFKVPES